ncbi:WD repeat-containing protein 36-like isoform X2 [Oscarella lobularis]|uniref:WD repeat-containing protein 36-like isoform X2 n=1 Tax=Oscarella lobularis TaxID=121494 RepID=UPI0033139D55
MAASQLFAPYRALGFVSSHVPAVLHSAGADSFITTAIGRTFHYYNCAKLNLTFVGIPQFEPISCLASQGMLLFTASGLDIKLWKRAKEIRVFRGHRKNIHSLLPFGEHLISVDDDNEVKIWNSKSTELYSEMEFDASNFRITTVMHSSTYLNKILFGSGQGSMQLWNVKTNQLIYSFEGWASSVLVIAQAPAVDVVAVGLQNGNVVVHNLKFDATLMKFQQDWGPVTQISFRTDHIPVMASAGTAGHVALWDLEKKRLLSTMYDCHDGSVSSLHFLPSQPLLVSTGQDNSINVWIFDMSDGGGRLLRSRKGHSAPPIGCQFYGSSGQLILTTGLDRAFRVTCTVKDEFNTELSQGSVIKKAKLKGVKAEELKLSPITAFSAEEARERDWDNVATCHRGSRVVRTWNYQNKCIGKHKLDARSVPATAKAECVVVSHCGNFVLIGYSSGHVETFNIQSGLPRGSFGSSKAHDGPVRGVAINAVDRDVITGSADRTVKFWEFRSKRLTETLAMGAPVSRMLFHIESSMLAVALDDFRVHVIDSDIRRTIRTFSGHENEILDMTFSPDSRWLITSSMDSSVRTWDLPSARLIDYFIVESPATGISLSPTGDFLATIHADDLGIYLWSNKTLYSQVSLRPLPVDYQPRVVDLPTTTSDDNQSAGLGESVAHAADVKDEVDADDDEESDAEQLADYLVTLSRLPNSRWKNLVHLDTIKERNKPKEPPKAPEAAPFFLPTVPGLGFKFATEDKDKAEDLKQDQSKLIRMAKLRPKSDFQQCLETCSSRGTFDSLIEMLIAMGSSAIAVELHCLGPDGGGSRDQLMQMMDFFAEQLETGKNFEMLQSILHVFLKVHGDSIASDEQLSGRAEELLRIHKETWTRVQDLLNRSSCLVNYFKSATLS